jgi:hypothetical protein
MQKIGTHFPIGQSCGPFEAWRLGWMMSEMWMTSTYNAASRTSWLGGAMPGPSPTGKAALREWQRLWSEKLMAGMEASLEMQRVGYDLLLGKVDPWGSSKRMLAPFHGRSVSNSRRLAGRHAGT